jgi:LPXTG-site transpeptidase (sortase) family protein
MRKILSALRSLANSIVSALRRHFTPLLLSSGIAILGYAAFQYGAMLFEQRRLEARWLEQQRILQPDDSRSRIALSSTELTRISIPSIQFAAVIVEGTDESSLLIGPGHLAGTAEPGEPGNAVVSGHRDTFFRNIIHLAPGDPILIERRGRIFTYLVENIRIVKPNDRSVAEPSGDNRLTLITCDPAYYPGSAPQRLVIVSKLEPAALEPSVAGLKRPLRHAALRKVQISGPER